MDINLLVEEAHELVLASLKNFPHRIKHSMSVAHKMWDIGNDDSVFLKNCCYLVGLLHDIGYGYPLTGHHDIDGAYFLKDDVMFSDLAPYVAWHSTSAYESDARNIPNPFPKPDQKYL